MTVLAFPTQDRRCAKCEHWTPLAVHSPFGLCEIEGDALARGIVFENDEGFWGNETPENRFIRMRNWIERNLKPQDLAHDKR